MKGSVAKLVVDVGNDGEIANMLELSAGNVMRHRVCSTLLVRKRGSCGAGPKGEKTETAPLHCQSSSKDKRYCSDMRGIGTAVRREPPDWRELTLGLIEAKGNEQRAAVAIETHGNRSVVR